MERCPDYEYDLQREMKLEEQQRMDTMFYLLLEELKNNQLKAVTVCSELKATYQDEFDTEYMFVDFPIQSLLKHYEIVYRFIANDMEQKFPSLHAKLERKVRLHLEKPTA